ncbi:MAG TPA: zinc ribbon domain-containing protein, partial [Ignavibacteria bacterium]|nr:zinc ribbon domain-containing protein [Ignavibacteria bacterium]
MPFYEYKCSNCGHELEELQSITAAPLVKCPECGKDTLQRLIGTGAGLIFKGSGFYLTDYKNQNSKSRGGGEKKP